MKLICQFGASRYGGRSDVQENTDDSTHEESEETESVLADVEAVILDKDEWECLKLDLSYTPGLGLH
jgi:hypothetical protein